MKLSKKIFSLLLSLALLFSLLPVLPVSAATSGDWGYTLLPGNLIEITRYKGSATDLVFPNQLDGYAVTSIGSSICYGRSELTSVTISDGVRRIGDSAFSGCTGLTSLNLGSTVTEIGKDSFYRCTGLKELIIPDSVLKIDVSAFAQCSGLTSVTFGANVGIIESWAFAGCTSLTSVVIPKNVETLRTSAFNVCSALTEIRVDAENPFYSSDARGVCFDKEKTKLLMAPRGIKGAYSLPTKVKTIGEEAFRGCSELTSVTFGSTMEYIMSRAFYDCSSLTKLYFTGDTISLGDYVFELYDSETETESINPELTIYYPEGETGWTSPTWMGFPTVLWDGVRLPCVEDFTDVPSNEWYFSAVDYVLEHRLFNGTSNTTFEPSNSMTRAMLVTVLWRMEGEMPPTQSNPFTDVPAGQWYSAAVLWAAENEIVNGVGDGKFDPNGNVTREQMAAIMFRYAIKKEYKTTQRANLSVFPDSGSVSSWATESLSWANAVGIINGSKEPYNGTRLLPAGNATRAQVAAIFMRFMQTVAKTSNTWA